VNGRDLEGSDRGIVGILSGHFPWEAKENHEHLMIASDPPRFESRTSVTHARRQRTGTVINVTAFDFRNAYVHRRTLTTKVPLNVCCGWSLSYPSVLHRRWCQTVRPSYTVDVHFVGGSGSTIRHRSANSRNLRCAGAGSGAIIGQEGERWGPYKGRQWRHDAVSSGRHGKQPVGAWRSERKC
jgi:hypothetical protein